MQHKISIAEILNNKVSVGTQVTVYGWLRTRRDSKAGCSFLALSDGSCFNTLQVIAPNSLENYNSDILHATTGCSLEVIGTLVASPSAGQSVELQATTINILGNIEDPEKYPITPKYHTLEYLRDFAHLRVRTNTIGAVTRVRHCLAQAIHRFFHERGFYWIHTPIITTNDCEGAGQQFRVTTLDLENVPRLPNGKIDYNQDFFANEAFLTVSGQLNVETYCQALSKVYTFGPTFRAENSNTSRHLAEFWMIEPEMSFADLNDIAQLAQDMLQYLAKTVLEERADDMAFFAQRVNKDCITRLEKIVSGKFTRMNYTDAITELEKVKDKFTFPVYWGVDLQSEHERYLTEELVQGPVILMNYPKDIKSFYMRVNDDEKTVSAMDVLVPGIGEIIGGSQREERYDVLLNRMQELGLKTELYSWYLDLRRYGTSKHSGFGLGFERLISYVTGVSNIRDVIPFPRTPKHAEF